MCVPVGCDQDAQHPESQAACDQVETGRTGNTDCGEYEADEGKHQQDQGKHRGLRGI